MNQKLQIQVSTCNFPPSSTNPWGDFDRVLILRTRLAPVDGIAGEGTTLYFKVCKHTGGLADLTLEQFKDACVESALQGAIPSMVEL